MERKTVDRNRIILSVLALTSMALLIATVIGLIYYNNRIDVYSNGGDEMNNAYKYVYALIAEDKEDNLSDSM